MQIEHVIPQALGGSDDTDNLVGSCKTCNRRKGTKDYAAFITSELETARRVLNTLELRYHELHCSKDPDDDEITP